MSKFDFQKIKTVLLRVGFIAGALVIVGILPMVPSSRIAEREVAATPAVATSEECPLAWQSTYYASTSASIFFPLGRDGNEYTDIALDFDDHTGGRLDHDYWGNNPCSDQGALYEFYTNADSGQVIVTNHKTGEQATVIVTNPVKIAVPHNMDERAFALVKHYLSDFKTIEVFMQEDVNNDTKNDYALYVEDTLLSKTQKNTDKERTLIIITSTPDGGYEISGHAAPRFLDCGECGGASFPSGPMVSAWLENGELIISEEAGTAFRRYSKTTLVYKDSCWRSIKGWGASGWLNGGTEEEGDWTEGEYELEGKCIE